MVTYSLLLASHQFSASAHIFTLLCTSSSTLVQIHFSVTKLHPSTQVPGHQTVPPPLPSSVLISPREPPSRRRTLKAKQVYEQWDWEDISGRGLHISFSALILPPLAEMTRWGVVVCTCNLHTRERCKQERSYIWGQPGLCTKFQTSLSY